ncbi:MAG: hypothetical protein J6K73_06375 [Clostridia bacterium]|nr:hypothetical protein [Clostridia bacterium]
MKKSILLALCLALAGLLAVNGTFAAEFTQTVSEVVSTLFKTVQGLAHPEPTVDPSVFSMSLVYPDNNSSELPMLFPGSEVERKIAVRNDSSENTAYFRIAFAVQAEAFPYMTLSFNNDGTYAWLNEWRNITIGGRDYKLMIGTHSNPLEAGKTSSAALLSVAMSETVTSEQMVQIDEDFLQVQVLAINANDFDENTYTTAKAALDAALPIDSTDFNPFN